MVSTRSRTRTGHPTTVTVAGSRGRVLSAIRAAGEPVGVEELAEIVGLHPGTVRFHLTALLANGLVSRDHLLTGGKGRPRALYQATAEGVRTGERNYLLLSEVLLESLAETAPDPAEAALEAGRTWGGLVASAVTSDSSAARPPSRAADQLIVEAAEEMGFDPQAHPARHPTVVLLRNCPFREAVDQHAEIVCALHRGLIDGVVAACEDPPALQTRLEPFAQPGCCIIHLHRAH